MSKRSRSAAAKKGWATRRRKEHEAAAERARRSTAAKRGWDTRKSRAFAKRKAPPGGSVVPPKRPPRPPTPALPVYDIEEVERGAELGYARTEEGAHSVAESANRGEVEDVWKGDAPPGVEFKRAWLVRFAPDIPEDVSDEWEIGFEYRGADKGSNVDVNVRIARMDGALFGATEAANVLSRFRHNMAHEADVNPVPAGYRLAYIDWRRPRWRSDTFQSGDDDDLAGFRNPMYTEADNDAAWSILPADNVRLGSIKK